jgi:hypothetical protein
MKSELYWGKICTIPLDHVTASIMNGMNINIQLLILCVQHASPDSDHRFIVVLGMDVVSSESGFIG